MEKAKKTIRQLPENLLKRYNELKPTIRSAIENNEALGGYADYIMGHLNSIRSGSELVATIKRFADIDISVYKM